MHKIEVFLPITTDIDSLEEILFTAGVVSLSVTEMQVFDKKEMKTVNFRGAKSTIRHSKRLKVEIITGHQTIDSVVSVLQSYHNNLAGHGLPAYVTHLSDMPISPPKH